MLIVEKYSSKSKSQKFKLKGNGSKHLKYRGSQKHGSDLTSRKRKFAEARETRQSEEKLFACLHEKVVFKNKIILLN